MSEKTCVGRNGLGKLQSCAWAGAVGRSGFLASRGSFGKVSLPKGSAIQCQISRFHRKNIQSLEGLPELSPPVWGFTLSSSPLFRFCFPFYSHLSVSLTDLTFLGRNVKLPTSHLPPSVSSKIFIVFYILSSIITFSFLIWQAGCSREQPWLFPVVLQISAMPALTLV